MDLRELWYGNKCGNNGKRNNLEISGVTNEINDELEEKALKLKKAERCRYGKTQL